MFFSFLSPYYRNFLWICSLVNYSILIVVWISDKFFTFKRYFRSIFIFFMVFVISVHYGSCVIVIGVSTKWYLAASLRSEVCGLCFRGQISAFLNALVSRDIWVSRRKRCWSSGNQVELSQVDDNIVCYTTSVCLIVFQKENFSMCKIEAVCKKQKNWKSEKSGPIRFDLSNISFLIGLKSG